MRQRAVGQRARLVSERGVFAARQIGDQRGGGERTGLLVRIDHDIVADPRGIRAGFESAQSVEDDVEAALHVGGARAV